MDALKRMVWLAVWLASLRLCRRASSISIGSFVAAHLRFVIVLLVSWFIASDSLHGREQSGVSSPFEIGIRIVWGHDMPRNYVGEIEAVQASVKSAVQIGIDPDDSGLFPKDAKGKYLIRDNETRFGGCDLVVRGAWNGQIIIRLRSETSDRAVNETDVWQSHEEVRLSLADCIDGAKELSLASPARVVVDRIPGDRLRVVSEQDDWIFAPNEPLAFQVVPSATAWKNQAANLEWSMIRKSDNTTILEQSTVVTLDSVGNAPPVSFHAMTAPTMPGVYELQLTLEPKRFLPNFGSPRSSVRRNIQFVVCPASDSSITIADAETVAAEIRWKQRSYLKKDQQFDLAQNNRRKALVWERFASTIPRWKGNSRFSEGPIVELEPGGTFRVPIELARDKLPVLLGLDFPILWDKCVIRILQPGNNKQSVAPIMTARLSPSNRELLSPFYQKTGTLYHRELQFTSPIKSVILEVSNPSKSTPIRLENLQFGQANTPQRMQTDQTASSAWMTSVLSTDQLRGMLAQGRKVAGTPYDTWESVELAFTPWLQSCQREGYSGVSIPVLSQESTIYPSNQFVSVPWLDTGRFDQFGRDPNPKDIVRWLYHQTHSLGLTFLPVFEWNGSLSSFASNPEATEDMLQSSEVSSSSPRWNPLHPKIQKEIQSVLIEFEQRYRNAPGYSGYALHIQPESHLNIAAPLSSLPDMILDRFATKLKGNLPSDPARRREAILGVGANAFDLWQRQQVYDSIIAWKRDIRRMYYQPNTNFGGLKVESIDVMTILPPTKSPVHQAVSQWWSDGISKCSQMASFEPSHQDSQELLIALREPWLKQAQSVPRSPLQRSMDRIKVWQSPTMSRTGRALMINANPIDAMVELKWDAEPGSVQRRSTRSNSFDIEERASEHAYLVPAQSMIVLEWQNQNASLVNWISDEKSTEQSIQSAILALEKEVNQRSVFTPEPELLSNPSFELGDGELVDWATSLNPKVIFRSDDTNASHGNKSLRVSFEPAGGSAWMQSAPFELETNRLHLSLQTINAAGAKVEIQVSLLIWNVEAQRFERLTTQEGIAQRTAAAKSGWNRWSFDFSSDLAKLEMTKSDMWDALRVRLQIDLKGDGEMAIDNLEASTKFLLETERVELRNKLFVTKRELAEGNSETAIRLLDSNWYRIVPCVQVDTSADRELN
jgi:hypothetical protein